jgi:hypothetical protein
MIFLYSVKSIAMASDILLRLGNQRQMVFYLGRDVLLP